MNEFPVNESTVMFGQSKATCLKKTVSHSGVAIASVVVECPLYITPELLRHRSFSFCQQSGRATPSAVLLDQVRINPAFFDEVGINQSGMVAEQSISPEMLEQFRSEWESLAKVCASYVRRWSVEYKIHKQVANRALIPFMRTRLIITATDWDGFFEQRISPKAQPEMRHLAECIDSAIKNTTADIAETHLPWGTESIIQAVARSARVCVGSHTDKEITPADDIRLVRMLFENRHLSPFEHIAYETVSSRCANFRYWKSFRFEIETFPDYALYLLSVDAEKLGGKF